MRNKKNVSEKRCIVCRKIINNKKATKMCRQCYERKSNNATKKHPSAYNYSVI